MAGYGVYATLAIGIPVGTIGLLLLCIPTILGSLVACVYYHTCQKLPGIIGKLIIIDFDEKLTEQGEKYKYFFFGQKVNRVAVIALSCTAVLVFFCAFIAFWNTFLTESFYGCDPTWDCFPVDLNGTVLQELPIVNCSEFENIDRISIICFRFVFKYSEGLGEAGGLVFALTLGTNLYVGLFVVLNRLQSKKWKWCGRSVVGFFAFGLFCVPLILLAIPGVLDSIRTPQRALQFVLYMVTLFVVIVVLGISMCLYIPHIESDEEGRTHKYDVEGGAAGTVCKDIELNPVTDLPVDSTTAVSENYQPLS